ncbi:MAG: uroporphyrinogen decarboxylase family protein [Gemmatimonadota bacterium]|nr:uroporphyrinogen decarboxylase family protein [Gemmatimonadota bacterium]
MAVLQLRNHIPISGPARREAADGTESDMRVSLGFEPAWFSRRCGIDFSGRWHRDPFYRHDSLIKMKKELCAAFPSVGYWDNGYKDDLATISGCYGAYVIPRLFGCSLIYAKDRWPCMDGEYKLSIEDVERLDIDTVLSNPFIDELFGQMDTIESEWGKIHGYLNWQGVLNTAFNLRGQDILMDIFDKPDFVHHFFSVICEVMIKLARMVQERQRKSGFYLDHFCVSDCTVNMVSPENYRDFIFPYDKNIAGSFERFGVHTCNWDVTPYLEELRKLPRVGYLDMGMMSDMAKARSMFPDSRRAVLYSPVRLQDSSWEEIKKDMEKICRDLSPCDIVMADIQATTPDGRVNELLRICRELESGRRDEKS